MNRKWDHNMWNPPPMISASMRTRRMNLEDRWQRQRTHVLCDPRALNLSLTEGGVGYPPHSAGFFADKMKTAKFGAPIRTIPPIIKKLIPGLMSFQSRRLQVALSGLTPKRNFASLATCRSHDDG